MQQENAIREFTFEDGDKPLRFHFYRGEWVCMAIRLAEWLGYDNPSRLVDKLRNEWSDEFVDGEDYWLLSGRDLANFRRETPAAEVSNKARQAVLLSKEGAYGALLKTAKPKGRAARTWLRKVVFPALESAGQYTLGQENAPRRLSTGARLRA